MDPMTNETDARSEVPVWDWPVRAVHWAMALLVAALLATGLVGNDALTWHMRFGETLLVLVLFRVIWGFAGSGNARFASFVRGPGSVVAYVRSIFRPPHEIHATHNPIGGWMVVALLLAMFAQAGAGLFTQDDIGNEGPLVKLVSDSLSESLGWYHRRGWWLVAGLASLHILAVIGYLAVLGDNLIWPMVTGVKQLPARVANAANASSSTTRAVVLLAVLAALMWWVVNRL
jgi:cytochrome b